MCNEDGELMTGGNKQSRNPSGKSGTDKAKRQPDWAQGLQKLYSSVVEEPLPDMFQDLLRRLDGDDRG